MSNIIVKRSRCLEVQDVEKYFGCQWLHLALLTEIVNPDFSAYIFNYKTPLVTVRLGNQRWLENEGAILFYYNALTLFRSLGGRGYDKKVFEQIKRRFRPLIMNGGRINFSSLPRNVRCALRFFAFYYNMPVTYLEFALRLVLKPHRRFFEGWESLGTK